MYRPLSPRGTKAPDPVKWILMRVNDTAYDFLQWKACIKEVQALCTELTFPAWLGERKIPMRLIAYEILRVLWSHPFHQYVWDIIHVSEVQDFNSTKTRLAAQFYHLLARLLLTTTEHSDDVEDLLEHIEGYIDVLPFKWAKVQADHTRELTWDAIKGLAENLADDPAWVAKKRNDRVSTEFGSEKKRDLPVYGSSPAHKRKRSNTDDENDDTPSKKPRSRVRKGKGKGKAARSRELVFDSDSDSAPGPSSRLQVTHQAEDEDVTTVEEELSDDREDEVGSFLSALLPRHVNADPANEDDAVVTQEAAQDDDSSSLSSPPESTSSDFV